ncbi:MAG: hypothetical protein H0X71_09775 [Rubrobacter sp.]|nr:hypothetical protein [Rubrobacter sp.]
MRIEERLWENNVEDLRALIRLLGGPGPEGTRKEFLIRYIVEHLTRPASLEELWEGLDPLSQKAVAAAYHNDGKLDRGAFAARYGRLPGRKSDGLLYSYRREPIPLDLFIHRGELPRELMPLLASLVPPPEKFRLQGLAKAPEEIKAHGEHLPLLRTDTERAGLHDLEAYLRLLRQGSLKHTATSSRLTPSSARTLLENLLDGDFFPQGDPERVKFKDTIRPFGLDVFVSESGLIQNRSRGELSDKGAALMVHQDAEALLDAFETWTSQGSFDELSRVTAIKGQGAKRTHLTPPAERREAVVEALSWCPALVWIPVTDFMRALKIWQFDFDLDRSDFSGLYVGDSTYGLLDYAGSEGWSLVKRLYVNAVLWEYLGSIGALDLIYLPPEEAGLELDYSHDEYFSPYDGLLYFRINPLGAYLLGQAGEYVPSYPIDDPLFSVNSDLILTLKDREHYQLDAQQILTTLESGGELAHISGFLARRHEGPLPAQVTDWLQEIEDSTHAFQSAGTALLIKARSQAMLKLVAEDPVLGKFVHTLGGRTLAIPASKEKAFRERLKDLGYLPPQATSARRY